MSECSQAVDDRDDGWLEMGMNLCGVLSDDHGVLYMIEAWLFEGLDGLEWR